MKMEVSLCRQILFYLIVAALWSWTSVAQEGSGKDFSSNFGYILSEWPYICTSLLTGENFSIIEDIFKFVEENSGQPLCVHYYSCKYIVNWMNNTMQY